MTDKIFVYRHGGLVSATLTGNAIPLTEGLEKYKSRGLFMHNMNFSPVSPEGAGRYHLKGYIDSPKPYLSDAVQIQSANPNTGLSCVGLSDHVIDFANDFARISGLKSDEPTKELGHKTRVLHDFIESLWSLSAILGERKRIELLREALREYCGMP